MSRLKDKIILNVFEFIQTKKTEFSENAKIYLTQLAKEFHVNIKKSAKSRVEIAFKEFIINEKGYNITIPKLYNSL